MKRPLVPRHIKVGPFDYRVIRLPKGSPELVDDDGTELHGKCDFNTTTIYHQIGES